MNRSIRIIAAALGALLLPAALTGCISVNITGSGVSYLAGKGAVIAQDYEVGDYTALSIGADVEVIYSSAPSTSVRLELYENQLEHVEIANEEGVLRVDSKKRFSSQDTPLPKLYVSTPSLSRIDVSGSAYIEQADPISAESFVLNISGSCYAGLELTAEEVDLQLSGAGAVELSGSTGQLRANLSGVATLSAEELQAKDAVVRMSGVGSASIWCTDSLDATLSGVGSLEYRGNPATLNKNISGLGTISPM